MNEETRRGFAARLTLGRAPERWSGMVRRWLFTGDWLGDPVCDERMPYVRLFVLGAPPASCRDEDAIWREVHNALCGVGKIEPGSNHREISYPEKLPEWSRHIGKGDGMDSLRARIGQQAADEWLDYLWRRASRQWPALGRQPAHARQDCFELHQMSLPGNREGLAVVLRPSKARGLADERVAPAVETVAA